MRKILIVLISFNAITAFTGGLGLIFGWIDVSNLEIQPKLLSNALLPGLLLAGVVGGTSLAAAIALIKHTNYAFTLTFVSSLVLQTWIITEMYLVAQLSWLQIFYLILGFIIMILSANSIIKHMDKQLKDNQ